MSHLKWDGNDLWVIGEDYNHPTNPHIYTGITIDKRFQDSQFVGFLKQLIVLIPEMTSVLHSLKEIQTDDDRNNVTLKYIVEKLDEIKAGLE